MTCDLQLAACDLQIATCDLEPETCDLQIAAFDLYGLSSSDTLNWGTTGECYERTHFYGRGGA